MSITQSTLSPQTISTDVLVEKYIKADETSIDDIYRRVAKGIAAVEKTAMQRKFWEDTFYRNMHAGAIGAGRIMSSAGTGIKATLMNCFVMGVGDCIQGFDDDGYAGIYEALRQAAETMRRGGGVGYDFSRIRPRNSFVKGTHSMASGPCSYMDVFDSSCRTVESAGQRRGAQMGVLKVSHPDILDFVTAKRTPGRWNNFNVSVFITDAFMEAKNSGADWELTHKEEPSIALKNSGSYLRSDGLWVYSKINAKELWDTIMKSNYDFAEPGILFEDNINNDNNLRYVERLDATNPCGEQPLPPYGCCDLGPINLTLFVKKPFTPEAYFDFDAFVPTVTTQVRFLDNVLEATLWPLPEQKQESDNKRRIGVGFTGLGNALAMLNLIYASDAGLEMAKQIAVTMRDTAYLASVELAKEKGAFPLFNAKKYLESGTFASRLPRSIKSQITKHGIRNSHLLSVAPTGTVSLAFCDNASNGIEPPFSLAYSRKKRNGDGAHSFYQVIDHGLRVYLSTIDQEEATAILDAVCAYAKEYEFKGVTKTLNDALPESLVVALEMSAKDHLEMLRVVQPYIDSAISKTVNVPADYPFEDFKAIYDNAHSYRLKGVSTYRPNSIIGSVLSVGTEKEKVNLPDIDPLNIELTRRPETDLEAISKKVKYMTSLGDNTFYVCVSFTEVKGILNNQEITVKRPIEVFITAYPDGVPGEWVAVFARNMSLLARSGFNVFCRALSDSRKVKSDKGNIRYGVYVKPDGTVVPRWHDSDVACIAYSVQEILQKKGIVDESGEPITLERIMEVGEFVTVVTAAPKVKELSNNHIVNGKACTECGAHAVIKKDGCSFCTNCGYLGSCG